VLLHGNVERKEESKVCSLLRELNLQQIDRCNFSAFSDCMRLRDSSLLLPRSEGSCPVRLSAPGIHQVPFQYDSVRLSEPNLSLLKT
jgi:hypothetical protein